MRSHRSRHRDRNTSPTLSPGVGYKHAYAHGTSPSATSPLPPPDMKCEDILAETIDEAVSHFISAARQHNVEAVTHTALFINQLLVEAASRSRLAGGRWSATAGAEAAAPAPAGPCSSPPLLGVPLAPSPSLGQWVSSLDALAAAAVPAALRLMQQLHSTQPLVFNISCATVDEDDTLEACDELNVARRCLHALVNVCFVTVVAFRRTQTLLEQSAVQLRANAKLHRDGELLRGNRTHGGCDYLHETHAASHAAWEQWRAQLSEVESAMAAAFTRHLPLLIFSADQQLWAIREEATVSINGHPCLHDIPATPIYLAEQDGWVWLLVAVAVNVMGVGTGSVSRGGRGGAGTGAGGAGSNGPQSHAHLGSGGWNHRDSGSSQSSSLPHQWRGMPGRRSRRSSSARPSNTRGGPSPHGRSRTPHSHSPHASVKRSRSLRRRSRDDGELTPPSSPRLNSVLDPSVASLPSGAAHATTTTDAAETLCTAALGAAEIAQGPPGSLEDMRSGQNHTTGAASRMAVALCSVAEQRTATGTGAGTAFAAKFLSVVLQSFCLITKLWLKQRGLQSHVMETWRNRGARFQSATVTSAMWTQLQREMEDGQPACSSGCSGGASHSKPSFVSCASSNHGTARHSTMQDITLVLHCVSDIVKHASQLVLQSSENALELMQLLATVAPLQLLHVAIARQHQTLSEVLRTGETGRQRLLPLHFPWLVEHAFSEAVTQLLHATSEHIWRAVLAPLEGSDGVTEQMPPPVWPIAPPEACTTLLQIGLLHMFSETALASQVPNELGGTHLALGPLPPPPVSLGVSGIAAEAGANGALLPNDPLWKPSSASIMGRWVLLAYETFMAGEASARGLEPHLSGSMHFPRYCAGFAQCLVAAMEDTFALLMVVKSIKTPGNTPEGTLEMLHHGTLDLLAGVAARRLMQTLYHLRNSATAPIADGTSSANGGGNAAGLPSVTSTAPASTRRQAALRPVPFSAITEEAFNAIILILNRYEEAFMSGTTRPGHRQYWLLAVAHLRLSSVEASCTSDAHVSGALGRVYPFTVFEGMADYVCADPRDSVAFLRDRSYESYDEGLQKEGGSSRAHQQRDREPTRGDGPGMLSGLRQLSTADSSQLFRIEVRDPCDVVRERLVMSSARFLAIALRLTRTDRSSAVNEACTTSVQPMPPSPPPAGRPAHRATSVRDAEDAMGTSATRGPAWAGGVYTGAAVQGPALESQATVYVDAFTRFLLMKDAISTSRLISCLHCFQEELRLLQLGSRSPAAQNLSDEWLLTETDTNEARLFNMEVALFTM